MSDNRGIAAVRANPYWTLLVLRAFLAFTFLYAGLSKIADSSFLDDDDPSSMHATLVAVKDQSPIGGLLGPVMDHSFAFGVMMALGEVAVGIGLLLGLFTRVAAVGGMLLTLSLFLTVSWGADPWYTGADIVYVFALTPLVLSGPTPFSVDEWLARSRAETSDDTVDRTRLLVVAGAAAAIGAVSVGISALLRGSDDDAAADSGSGTTATPTATPTATSTGRAAATATAGSSAATSTASAPTGAALLAASAVPVGGGAQAKEPKSGDAVWVLQLESGDFTAYNATCPHQQCAVTFVSKSAGFACPCHQSKFDSTGAVTKGPATRGLTKIEVAEAGGQIVET